MLEQAEIPCLTDSTQLPHEQRGLDLRTVVAETVALDGDLLLVVTDERSRACFNPGNAGEAMSAIRGALRLAAAAAAHARRLSAQLDESAEHGPLADGAAGSHLPITPSWVCTWCDRPWPCPTTRRRLIAEYIESPTALYLLMTLQFADATGDLSVAELPHLHQRFLGWIPNQPRP